jgi:hypothetical protein
MVLNGMGLLCLCCANVHDMVVLLLAVVAGALIRERDLHAPHMLGCPAGISASQGSCMVQQMYSAFFMSWYVASLISSSPIYQLL